MHLKNPIFLYIISLIIFCILLALIIYINSIRSAGAIYLKEDENLLSGNNNFYVISVVAEDLKVPFFGTAFHVNYDPQNYTYDHFTLGNYFETQDDPLVLVNANVSNQNLETGLSAAKIIVGISLKRGQLITKPEGTLLKLYFKKISNQNIFNNFSDDQNSSNEFSFSNAVFSSFDKQTGERNDIKNIKFIDQSI